jgi:hypothetical protein
MRNTLLVTCLLSMFVAPAFAQPRPGQYTGVRKCTATVGSLNVEATSKKTIGVATCKGELQKLLVDKGVCIGKRKREAVVFSFQFGADDAPNKATGTAKLICKGS